MTEYVNEFCLLFTKIRINDCTDLGSLQHLSRLFAQASMYTYDAATGIFSTTLKIDCVTHGER